MRDALHSVVLIYLLEIAWILPLTTSALKSTNILYLVICPADFGGQLWGRGGEDLMGRPDQVHPQVARHHGVGDAPDLGGLGGNSVLSRVSDSKGELVQATYWQLASAGMAVYFRQG